MALIKCSTFINTENIATNAFCIDINPVFIRVLRSVIALWHQIFLVIKILLFIKTHRNLENVTPKNPYKNYHWKHRYVHSCTRSDILSDSYTYRDLFKRFFLYVFFEFCWQDCYDILLYRIWCYHTKKSLKCCLSTKTTSFLLITYI